MLEGIFPSLALRRARMRREIAEELAGRKAAQMLAESIPTFAMDRDEGDWSTSSSGREPLNYSETDLDTMFDTALELSYHPGARGLLDTMESFVIGESMHVIAEDENPKVQDYWDEWAKLNNWDMRAKECFRSRFLRDGEVFLRWFKPKAMDGEISTSKGHELVRFVEPKEIKNPAGTNNWGQHSWGIETDLDDIEKPITYYRNFAYTPAGSLTPENRWEQIKAADIDHFKHGVDSNVKRGRSWLLGIGKYIVMNEQWLDQRWQLNRVRNLFAVIGNLKGIGGSSVTDLKAKFTDTSGRTKSGEGTPKKMPRDAMVLLQRGIEWDLKSLNLNAADAAQDGRNFQLQIAVGTGLAEYVVRGDASNANFASTMVAECPMVRMFQKYQDYWRWMQSIIFARVIRYGIETGQLSAKSTRTPEGQLRNARRALRCALREGRSIKVQHITDRIALIEAEPAGKSEEVSTSLDCQVEFPPLIHRDIKTETEALVMQRQSGWVSDQTCSAALGYDYEQEKTEIDRAERDAMTKAKQADKENW